MTTFLNSLHSTENEAQQIIDQAHQDARARIAQAREKQREDIHAHEKECLTSLEQRIDEQQKMIEERASEIRHTADTESDSLRTTLEQRTHKSVSTVVESLLSSQT